MVSNHYDEVEFASRLV